MHWGQLHERHEKLLAEHHSLDSLAFLLMHGREIEFSAKNQSCFLSRHGSAQTVSLWINQQEQSFSSETELFTNAQILGKPFLQMWEKAQIETIL